MSLIIVDRERFFNESVKQINYPITNGKGELLLNYANTLSRKTAIQKSHISITIRIFNAK